MDLPQPHDIAASLTEAAMSAGKTATTVGVEATLAWQRQLAQWRTTEAYQALPLAIRAGLLDPQAMVQHHFDLAARSLDLQREWATQWAAAWERTLRGS